MTVAWALVLACTSSPSPDKGDTPPVGDDTDDPVVDTDIDTGAPRPVGCDVEGVSAWFDDQGFPTVDEAVDAAPDAAVVVVCPGTHPVRLRRSAPSVLHLRGATGDPDDAVLVPRFMSPHGGNALIDVAAASAHLTLEHLTLREAFTVRSPAVIMTVDADGPPSTLTIDDCVFEDNVAWASGAGFATVNVADVTITRSVFRRNESLRGATVSLERVRGDVTVRDVRFEDNVGDFTAGLAVYRQSWSPAELTVALDGVTFARNRTYAEGNGTAFHVSSDALGTTHVDVRNSSFIENAEDVQRYLWGAGGAAYVGNRTARGAVQVAFTDVLFDGNIAETASHLFLDLPSYDVSTVVTLSRTQLWRGDRTGSNDEPGDEEEYGRALAWHVPIGVRPDLTVQFDDVDFGDGATDNVTGDVRYCASPLGDHVFGTVSTLDGDRCPR